jgi:hypothetical protein
MGILAGVMMLLWPCECRHRNQTDRLFSTHLIQQATIPILNTAKLKGKKAFQRAINYPTEKSYSFSWYLL